MFAEQECSSMAAAKTKKAKIPPANLAKATISLRDAVLAGGAIVTAALIGGAAWKDINKDVQTLQVDVTEIKGHQRETKIILDKIVGLVEKK